METETLTYDFGTTPEGVIWERVAEWQAAWERGADIGPHGSSLINVHTDPSDLLTVLDALALSAATTRYRTDRKDGSPVFNCDGEGNRLPDYMQRPYGQYEACCLRIEILAALGVTEV